MSQAREQVFFAGRLLMYWRNSYVPIFLKWWREQLISCLPRRWQLNKAEPLLFWSDDGITLSTSTNGDPRNREVACCLVLPREYVLLRVIWLPVAAMRDLPSVLAYEMDKYTPFKAGQVYYDCQRISSGRDKYLGVNLVVTLRERLDTILEETGRLGYSIGRVDVNGGDGTGIGVNFLSENGRRSQGVTIWQWLNRVLLLSLVASIALAMMLLLQNRKDTLEDMRQEVQALRGAAMDVQLLRQKLNDVTERGQRLLLYKKQAISKIGLLEELSRCIPSDTWLEQLEITQEGHLNINGQTSQPSMLLNKMRDCASLTGQQFQGVIQADDATGKDRFFMLAYVRDKEIKNAPPSSAD